MTHEAQRGGFDVSGCGDNSFFLEYMKPYLIYVYLATLAQLLLARKLESSCSNVALMAYYMIYGAVK